MSHQGKLSRAMAKSGSGDMLSAEATPAAAKDTPTTEVATTPLAAPAAPVVPKPAPPAPAKAIARVTGQADTPGYSMVIVADRLGEVAAQVRALRGKILAMNEGNPPRVITITSGTREEGKSTVSANLGEGSVTGVTADEDIAIIRFALNQKDALKIPEFFSTNNIHLKLWQSVHGLGMAGVSLGDSNFARRILREKTTDTTLETDWALLAIIGDGIGVGTPIAEQFFKVLF